MSTKISWRTRFEW